MSHIEPEHGLCLFTTEGETEQFLYRDLLEEGDLWCRSGDILERDAAGFLYLSKRIGEFAASENPERSCASCGCCSPQSQHALYSGVWVE